MIKLVEWSSEIQVQKRSRMDAGADREAEEARREEAKIRVNMQIYVIINCKQPNEIKLRSCHTNNHSLFGLRLCLFIGSNKVLDLLVS